MGTYWARSRVRLLIAALAAIAAAAFVLRPSGSAAATAVLVLITGRTALLLLGAPVRAARHSDRWVTTLLCDRSTGLVILLLALAGGVPPITAYWLAMSCGVVASLACGLIVNSAGIQMFRGTRLANPWRGCQGYAASSASISVATLDVTLLGVTSGAYQAGIYGAVNRWTQPIQLLADSFSQVAAPFMAAAATGRAAVSLVRRSLWIPALGLVVAVAMAVLAPFLIQVLLGPAYAKSAPTLALLAGGAALVLINQPVATLAPGPWSRPRRRAGSHRLCCGANVDDLGVRAALRRGRCWLSVCSLSQALLLAWLGVMLRRIGARGKSIRDQVSQAPTAGQ